MLRKSPPEPQVIVQWFNIPIHEDFSYEEAPIQMHDRKMKTLRRREIPLVIVLWQYQDYEEAT